MEKEIEIAKRIIIEEVKKSGLEVINIFIFGSRARENYAKDSNLMNN